MAQQKMMKSNLNDRFTHDDLGGVKVVSIGAESGDTRIVSLQFMDKNGNDMAKKCAVMAYLSSNSGGDTLEADSSTLTIAASTDGIVAPLAAVDGVGHTVFMIVSENDGDADVSIAQTSGADTFYLNIILPNGEVFNSDVITFAA